ncbi:MAG: DUF4143 domain-containing protein, partial [Chitinivibrionales bacterium]|nr:DUF4143 domain-containing protein [Chitinivibrionales bacterium]
KTVEGFFSVVEDLLIGFRLPVFNKRAQRALSVHPKFYYFDCGVYRSLRPKGPLDRPEEIAGGSLEGLIAQHLRAWIDYGGIDTKLFFWRTRAGNEVDFVVYGENTFVALEVKAAVTVKRRHLHGLKAFRTDYPQCRTILLYMGPERMKIDDILCVPCSQFLLNLVPGNPIPFTTE